MTRAAHVAWGALAALTALAGAHPARAACPSYTPSETSGTYKCGVDPAPGANPSVADWKPIFAMAAGGAAKLGPKYPDLGTMGAGCGHPTAQHTVPTHFPCHVLMALAMIESGWRQFCVPDAPSASVGAPSRTIVSFDCGYGIAQVTSGMHVGESPAFDRALVAADPTYNLATGTLILRDKWIGTNCVGDNDPDLVEDWYTALWAYNGLAYSNNPNNPNLESGRGPYDPKIGGAYTYQEKILGYMEHPPDAAHWPALAPAYPSLGDIGNGSSPPAIPEPSCASPTSCAQTRPTHPSTCDAPPASDAGAPSDAAPPADDAGGAAEPDAAGGFDASASASGGCGCRVADTRGSPARFASVLAALLASLALGARRVRRVRPAGRSARRSAPR